MAEILRGKYVLERPLGSGGMAEVFLGRTIGAAGFSRPVAIKRIHAGCSADAQFRTMFVAEARLGARLSHGNIVSVLDFDEDEAGRLFLVMELVEGTDLDSLLGTGILPLPAVLFVAKEILRGLGHAHDLPVSEDGVRGLVHRDVSPHNVLISWDGAVKVSDFGIAKARAATNASASVLLKGKAAYMSPEQANGALLDGRSDLFAVGVMLWEMLCGTPLFGRDSLQATLKSMLFDPIPSPRSRQPGVPEDVERVTMRLLERDRERRYRDAGAAIAALDACAAAPGDGRELLSALLRERLADRARGRAAGHATRLEKPGRAPGAAGGDPAETVTGSAAAPSPEPAVAFPSIAPRRAHAGRALPLAMLGAATALVAGLAVGVAAHLRGGVAAAPLPPGAAPSPPSPASSEPANAEPPSTATITPRERAAAPAHAASAPVAAPQVDPGRTRVRRASAIDRREPQPPRQQPDGLSSPTPGPADRGGIRVIDLGDASRSQPASGPARRP